MKEGAKSMCFFCEKYYPGHKCAGKVYNMELIEESEGVEGHEGSMDGSEGYVLQ